MLQFGLTLLKILSKSKGFLGNLISMLIVVGLVAYFGSEYVNAAKVELKSDIEKNIKDIKVLDDAKQQMTTSLTLINNNLKVMNESLKSVKKSVDQTNAQTVQIYRDILHMKNGG